MWFDPLTAWVVALFTTGVPLAKEKIGFALEKEVPAENWGNKELIEKDRKRGVSEQEILRNVRSGRYIMRIQYPAPHRDPDSNKVIIENCELYNADLKQFGAYQTYKWVDQGKYNLNAEELKITHLQYDKKYLELYKLSSCLKAGEQDKLDEINRILASANWNCRNTEALRQWQQAHDANNAG